MNNLTAQAPYTRTATSRALAVIALVALGWSASAAQAVEIRADEARFQSPTPSLVVDALGGGLRFGAAGSASWIAATGSVAAVDMFSPLSKNQNNGYVFLTAGGDQFSLDSVSLVFNGGNDKVDGWFEFWNGSTLVASGSKASDVAEQLQNQKLSFHLGTDQRTTTLSGWSGLAAYNAVYFFYDNKGDQQNLAGITSFSVQSRQPNNQLGVAPAPVPEPSTYAMMLAGIGAIGFMTRRRRQSHD